MQLLGYVFDQDRGSPLMTGGEMAYLGLVICGFVAFAGTLAWATHHTNSR